MTATARAARRLQQTQPMGLTGGACALAAGTVAGVGVAAAPRVGVGLALAALMVAIALADLPLAVALWAVIVQLSSLPSVGPGADAAGVLVLGAWLVRAPSNRARIHSALRLHRRLLLIVAALLTWTSLSVAWAQDTSKAAQALLEWWLGAAILVVMVTSLRTARDVCVVMGGVVAGTLLSIAIGIAAPGLGATAAGTTVAIVEGRLAGGAGDPNYLAAFIVPLIVITGPLARATKSPARWLTAVAIAVLVIGLIDTESRGGLFAAAVALAAAIFYPPGRRIVVVAAAAAILCAASAAVISRPSVITRLAAAEADRGNGREDLWTVARRMSAQYPITGVGVGNFEVRALDYVRRPGSLAYVGAVIERPHVAHNTYLQALAETGLVGLGLLAAFVVAASRATLRAARRFAALGRQRLAELSRAMFIADIGLLTAAIFLSIGSDRTVWLLLGLGPVLLGVACRQEAGALGPDAALPTALPSSAPHALPGRLGPGCD